MRSANPLRTYVRVKLISTSDNTQTKRTFSVQTFVRNAFADRTVGAFLLIEELK